jgi:hypothetical protein
MINTLVTIQDENSDELFDRKEHLYYCQKLDKYLIPPKAEHRGNAYNPVDKKDNIPMKKQCKFAQYGLNID